MTNPLSVLKPKDQDAVKMILVMLDGKSIGEICDILDVVLYCINSSADINCDDDTFCVDKIKRELLGGENFD